METERAVLYARFSPRPNAATCESIEMQLERCRAYCTAYGWTVLSEFHDSDISGARVDNRPGLIAAVREAKKHRGVLVVYSLSRFARNAVNAIELSNELGKAKAKLVSITEHLDTTTPHGNFFFLIMAGMAQLEREQTAQRTRESMLRHQSAGRLMGSVAPYGFRIEVVTGKSGKDKKMLVPDAYEQAVIRRIIRMRKAGISARLVAEELNRLGLRARSPLGFTHVLVIRITQRCRIKVPKVTSKLAEDEVIRIKAGRKARLSRRESEILRRDDPVDLWSDEKNIEADAKPYHGEFTPLTDEDLASLPTESTEYRAQLEHLESPEVESSSAGRVDAPEAGEAASEESPWALSEQTIQRHQAESAARE